MWHAGVLDFILAAWSLLILGDLDPLPTALSAEPVAPHRNGEEPVL